MGQRAGAVGERALAGRPAAAEACARIGGRQDDPGRRWIPALAYDRPSWQILYATCAKLYNYPDASGAAGIADHPRGRARPAAVSLDGLRDTFTIRPGLPLLATVGRAGDRADVPPRHRTRHLAAVAAGPAAPAYFADIVGAGAFEQGAPATSPASAASGDRLTIRLTHPAPTCRCA